MIDLKEAESWSNPGFTQNSPLTKLNRAHRRKLLVQVELDRVEEELKMEIERNAVSEPASHPVFGSDDEDDDEGIGWNGEGQELDSMDGDSEDGLWDGGG